MRRQPVCPSEPPSTHLGHTLVLGFGRCAARRVQKRCSRGGCLKDSRLQCGTCTGMLDCWVGAWALWTTPADHARWHGTHEARLATHLRSFRSLYRHRSLNVPSSSGRMQTALSFACPALAGAAGARPAARRASTARLAPLQQRRLVQTQALGGAAARGGAGGSARSAYLHHCTPFLRRCCGQLASEVSASSSAPHCCAASALRPCRRCPVRRDSVPILPSPSAAARPADNAGKQNKGIRREDEPEEYWSTKSEREGKNPMSDPLAQVGRGRGGADSLLTRHGAAF